MADKPIEKPVAPATPAPAPAAPPGMFTADEVKSLVASVVKETTREVVTALRAKENLTPDQVHADYKKELQLPPGKPFEEIPCTSEETGASFIAVVEASTKFPQGRVVRLEEYKRPETVEVPEGIPRWKDGVGGAETIVYKTWVWQNYWQKDIKRYVGKPLPAHVRVGARVLIEPAAK